MPQSETGQVSQNMMLGGNAMYDDKRSFIMNRTIPKMILIISLLLAVLALAGCSAKQPVNSTAPAQPQPSDQAAVEKKIQGEIHGCLCTSNGKPVADVELTIFRKGAASSDPGWYDMEDQQKTSTDEKGYFSFKNLNDGEHTILVMPSAKTNGTMAKLKPMGSSDGIIVVKGGNTVDLGNVSDYLVPNKQ